MSVRHSAASFFFNNQNDLQDKVYYLKNKLHQSVRYFMRGMIFFRDMRFCTADESHNFFDEIIDDADNFTALAFIKNNLEEFVSRVGGEEILDINYNLSSLLLPALHRANRKTYTAQENSDNLNFLTLTPLVKLKSQLVNLRVGELIQLKNLLIIMKDGVREGKYKLKEVLERGGLNPGFPVEQVVNHELICIENKIQVLNCAIFNLKRFDVKERKHGVLTAYCQRENAKITSV